MISNTDFRQIPAQERLYRQEELILDVTENLCATLDARGITRTELATRLGVTKSAVTQMLDGANLQLRSVADICWALDCQVHIEICTNDGVRLPHADLTDRIVWQYEISGLEDLPDTANGPFAMAA